MEKGLKYPRAKDAIFIFAIVPSHEQRGLRDAVALLVFLFTSHPWFNF